MGCGSCSSGGCSTKSGGGGCGKTTGCATGGCNKLNTFDWLGNMLPPYLSETENVYEVRFKNTHKGFYRNVNGLRLNIGDWVVVEGDRGGFDIGQVTLGGVLAQLQLGKRSLNKPTISKLYRKANEGDLEMLEQARSKEPATLNRSRAIIQMLKLDMKLSDVEYQGDSTKATFHYIADARVDFRELIKLLAKEFRVRVEMKQIGLRHEAALLGGLGVCGRELCCSTWLTEFKVVTTSAARYQNLSLNPAKISGLCGRLKCCLNFELDAYKDALKDFPDVERLDTETGRVVLQKTDIFRYKMWFAYEGATTWYPLDVADVKKFHAMNKKGEKIPPLAAPVIDETANEKGKNDFINVVGQHDPEAEKRANLNRENRDRDRRRGNDRNQGQQRPQNNQPRDKRPMDKKPFPDKKQNPPQQEKRNVPQQERKTPPVVEKKPIAPQQQRQDKRPPQNQERNPNNQERNQNNPERNQAPRNQERNPNNQERKQNPQEKRTPPPQQERRNPPPQDRRNPPPQNERRNPPQNPEKRNIPPQNNPDKKRNNDNPQ